MVSCKGKYHIRFSLVCFGIGVHPMYDLRKCGEEKDIVYFKEKTEKMIFIWLVWGFVFFFFLECMCERNFMLS